MNLCLNGHSIICDSDTAAINIGREGILTITDCSVSETGKITHSDGKTEEEYIISELLTFGVVQLIAINAGLKINM